MSISASMQVMEKRSKNVRVLGTWVEGNRSVKGFGSLRVVGDGGFSELCLMTDSPDLLRELAVRATNLALDIEAHAAPSLTAVPLTDDEIRAAEERQASIDAERMAETPVVNESATNEF